MYEDGLLRCRNQVDERRREKEKSGGMRNKNNTQEAEVALGRIRRRLNKAEVEAGDIKSGNWLGRKLVKSVMR